MKLLELALKVHSGLERWGELQSLHMKVPLTSGIRIARKRGYASLMHPCRVIGYFKGNQPLQGEDKASEPIRRDCRFQLSRGRRNEGYER